MVAAGHGVCDKWDDMDDFFVPVSATGPEYYEFTVLFYGVLVLKVSPGCSQDDVARMMCTLCRSLFMVRECSVIARECHMDTRTTVRELSLCILFTPCYLRQVRTAWCKAAGLKRVINPGGHMDEGHPKLCDAELLALRTMLPNHGTKEDGLRLTDGVA